VLHLLHILSTHVEVDALQGPLFIASAGPLYAGHIGICSTQLLPPPCPLELLELPPPCPLELLETIPPEPLLLELAPPKPPSPAPVLLPLVVLTIGGSYPQPANIEIPPTNDKAKQGIKRTYIDFSIGKMLAAPNGTGMFECPDLCVNKEEPAWHINGSANWVHTNLFAIAIVDSVWMDECIGDLSTCVTRFV